MLYVSRQHLEIDALFWGINGQSACGEAGHGGYVAGAAALGFDDEDAAAGGGGGLSDVVAVADKGVEAGVAANGIFGAGDIVGDCGREEDHGDAEARVFFSGFAHLAHSCEGFEATDYETLRWSVGIQK